MVFHVTLWHVSPSPWLNQKQDAQKSNPCLYFKINLNKTSRKVTKDPKRVEAAHKGRENYMNKLKENILNDAKQGGGDTSNASNETTSATNTATASASSTTSTATKRSSDTYVYGIGILAVLAIGVCIFFTNNKKTGKVIHEEPFKPKRRHML